MTNGKSKEDTLEVLKRACHTLFEEGRSNVYIHEMTQLDLEDIEKLRDAFEQDRLREARARYEEFETDDNEEEQLRGDNE